MGCCFSKSENRKNRAAGCGRRCEPEDRSPPSPEVETVKEVLSETPTPVVNAAVPMERTEVEKATTKEDVVSADAAASDLGSSLVTDEVSEAASESSSVATSSVAAGPDRSPGKLAARRRPASAGLGPPARRDRDVSAVSYGVRSRSARGSPSPPPRHVTRDRSARRSPSPATAKRPSSSEQRRAAAPVKRKPPVPVMRPSGRVSPQRAQAVAPPPPPTPRVVLPTSPSRPENDAATVSSEVSVPDASAGGGDVHGDRAVDGTKESLENPLMSLECFIFL